MDRTLTIADIDVHSEGQGGRTLVMVHGWPDTYRLWDGQVEAWKASHTCVRFTLPGFDIAKPRRLVTLDAMVDSIAAVVDTVSPHKPVTLVLHDWGCYFGYQYALRHPHRVEALVGIDVGDVDSKEMKLPFRMAAFTVAYQLYLALAWLIGGKFGDGMTRWMAKKLNARTERDLIWSGMNYGYHLRWKAFFTGRSQGALPFEPQWPMLFLYGKNKPTMFHSPVFVDRLNAAPGSRAVGFEAGHWVMLDKPAEVSAEVLAWLS